MALKRGRAGLGTARLHRIASSPGAGSPGVGAQGADEEGEVGLQRVGPGAALDGVVVVVGRPRARVPVHGPVVRYLPRPRCQHTLRLVRHPPAARPAASCSQGGEACPSPDRQRYVMQSCRAGRPVLQSRAARWRCSGAACPVRPMT